jgi:murein DD-endopeptidase MepM/ murein hydrolase activator NlpD
MLRQGIIRKILIICIGSSIFAGVAVLTFPGLRVVPYTLSLLFRPAPTKLPVPVEGVQASRLVDTWGGPRSGGRRHEGIDIFGKRGTKIRSTTEGVVTTVGDNRLGGHSVWVIGPGGYFHYYAHLEKYGDVKRGRRIQTGHFIGTVGDSGNAKGTPPHLHYGIYKLSGAANNPYPLLKPKSRL